MSDNHNTSSIGGGSILTAFAIGALAGTTIALLYAPRSGRETRRLLVKRGQDLTKQATNVFNGAKETIIGKKAELMAAVDGGRQAMLKERARHHAHSRV